MGNKRKKCIVLVVCALMVMLSALPAYAANDEDSSIRRGPKYEYKTVYGEDFTRTFTGYPSGQPTKGYSFPQAGGAVYFSNSGGPTVTLTASLGGVYGNIAISTNLGKMATTGYLVNIPKSNNFYKVKVSKTLKFRPYITYRRNKGSSDAWEVYVKDAVMREVVTIKGEAVLVK